MAADFSGTDQYLDQVGSPVTGVPITFVAWYRYDTAIADEAEHAVLGVTDADAAQEMTIEIGRTGGVDYAIAMINAGGTVGFAVSSVPPTINTWQHLGGTYSATNRRDVYLDGTNRGNDTTSATPSGISNVNIGAILNSSSPIKDFNGAIAECAIYNVVLTDTEIATLAKGFSPLFIRPQNLVFYAPLIRGYQNLRGGTSMTNNSSTPFPHPRIIYPTAGQWRRLTTAAAPTVVAQNAYKMIMGIGV
jgi:hypothetical protein